MSTQRGPNSTPAVAKMPDLAFEPHSPAATRREASVVTAANGAMVAVLRGAQPEWETVFAIASGDALCR